jgi:hypothetical protein
MKNSDQYYKILKDKSDYKGVRYFRFNHLGDYVYQVVVNPGYDKKGRNSCFGIYFIHRTTFLSNYFTYYVEPCTKKEYEKNFDKVVKMLK